MPNRRSKPEQDPLLAELYATDNGGVLRRFQRVTQNIEDAKEQASETWLQAVLSRLQVIPEKKRHGYLRGIARNVERDYVRTQVARRRWLARHGDAGQEEPSTDPSMMEEMYDRERVLAALQRIAETDRFHAELLFHRVVHDETLEQTAGLCKVSLAKVRYQLPRAMARLMRELDRDKESKRK